MQQVQSEICKGCGDSLNVLDHVYFIDRTRVCKQCYELITDGARHERLGRIWAEANCGGSSWIGILGGALFGVAFWVSLFVVLYVLLKG